MNNLSTTWSPDTLFWCPATVLASLLQVQGGDGCASETKDDPAHTQGFTASVSP